MDAFEKITFPLGFGTSRLRSLNGGLSGRGARRLLEAAFHHGVRFFDTAPSYGQGQAESAIGSLPRRVLNECVICSKVGLSYGRKAVLIKALKPILQPAAKWIPALGGLLDRSRSGIEAHSSFHCEIQPAMIRASLEDSLRRLSRDHLDVLLLHEPSAESLNDDNLAELNALQSNGMIRRWGVSTNDIEVACRAAELENLAVLQLPIVSGRAQHTAGLLARCHDRQITVVANHVLWELGQTLASSPNKHDDLQSVVEACYEFVLRQPAVRWLLCGTTSMAHLTANVASIERLLRTTSVVR